MRSCKSTTKICLSCRYWQGKISTGRTKNGELYYIAKDSYSTCDNPESNFHEQTRFARKCCKNHDFR